MKLAGGQVVVQILMQEGVLYIVGIPGHGTLGLSEALLGQEELKYLPGRHERAPVYGQERAIGAEFAKGGSPISPDLTALARASGCHAEHIADAGEVPPALQHAFAAGMPDVVEVMVDRTYPLSGSPAVGWWDVPVPAYRDAQRARYKQERQEEQ